MKINRLTPVALGALGAALWALPVQAQGQAQGQEAAGAPKSASKPVLDAKALLLLQQVDAAYKGLGSYQSELKVEEFKNGDASKPVRVAKGKIVWQRPNQFAVEFGEGNDAVKATSDGTTLFASTTTDKVRYTTAAVPKGEGALMTALANTSMATLLLPSLVSGNSLIKMLGIEAEGSTTTLARGRADRIGGEDVDVVLATQSTQKSGLQTNYSFALGKEDHLLRQVRVTTGGGGRRLALSAIETISGIKQAAGTGGDLDAQTFAFKPAPEAEKVLSLQAPRYGATLKVGGKPFDFTAPDLAGQPLNLDQYKGKVVLLDFWATWCPPCRAEMPNILAAYDMYSSEGFDVVGVSLDSDAQALLQYIQGNGMKWRQVFDGKAWKSRVPGIYEVNSIPFSLLLGRDGKIVAMNPRGEALRPAIEAALGSP